MATGERGEARRRRILRAATELFLERGYEATSMDAVQRRAGGSKATIYAYFPGKEALFAAILAELGRGPLALEELRDAALSPEKALRAIGLKVLQAATSPWYAALQRRVLERAQATPGQARTFFEEGPGRSARALAARLATWHREGRLLCPAAERSALAFLAQVQGWAGLRALYGFAPPSPQARAAWVRACVRDFLLLHRVP